MEVVTDKSVIITLAIPVFFLLIIVEYIYGKVVGKNTYRINDTVTSITIDLLFPPIKTFPQFKGSGTNTTLMTLDTNGSLGIGETSPDELLHIKSSTSSKPVIKLENAGDVTNGAQIHFVMSTTSEGDNDIPGTIRFKGVQ